MPSIFTAKEKVINRVLSIKSSLISPNPNQPRVNFDDKALSSLAVSIAEYGILQPLTVRRLGCMFQLVSGERRLRASEIAGLEYVPCIVLDMDETESATMALIENIQREDLDYFEEALAIEKLIKLYGMTQESASERLGKAQSTIANKLRLLQYSEIERKILLENKLNEKQARTLLRLASMKDRLDAVKEIRENNLNSVQTEKLVDEMLEENPPQSKQRKVPKWIVKEVRLYINNINHTISEMKNAGIKYESIVDKQDDFITYSIKIPLK